MPRRLTAAELVQLAHSAGWSATQAPTAAAIALAESGGDPAARGGPNSNGSYDYGLWQINSVHGAAGKNWSDPATNAAMAYAVYRSQGWRAWTVYKTGAYLVHLPATRAAKPRGGYVPAGGAAPGGKRKCPESFTTSKTKPAPTDRKMPGKPETEWVGPGMATIPAEDEGDQWYRTAGGCNYLWKKEDQERLYWGNAPQGIPDSGFPDVSGISDPLEAAGDLLAFLSKGENWIRIVWVAGGSVLVIGALIVAMKGQR